MDSFMMAARVVLPMAMMVGIGMMLRIGKITDPDTMRKVDKITYNLFMPVLMFYNIYNTDFSLLQNVGYILYGVAGLIITFVAAMIFVPRFIPSPATAGAYGQTLIRPNYILFGAAVAQSIYGEGNIGIVMLMAAVAVPAFNSMASVMLESARNGSASAKKLLIAIAKNPTVIATFLGLVVNFSGFRFPELVLGVIEDISGITTPISFLSIGVTLRFRAVSNKRYLFSALLLRLIVIPLIFVSGAILAGFRGAELCAILILFAAPVAVSSYPMAVAMDSDGDFAAQMVALSTVLCLPTMFIWTLVLNFLHML